MHIRAQIRNALKTALTGLATTGDRVHINHTYNLKATELPALIIRTPTETVELVGFDGPQIQRREMSITVEAVTASAALDTHLDQIGAEVESAVYSAGLLNNRVKTPLQLERVETGFDDLATPPMGFVRMTYSAVAMTQANNPQIAI
jgi:hypothetical protein